MSQTMIKVKELDSKPRLMLSEQIFDYLHDKDMYPDFNCFENMQEFEFQDTNNIEEAAANVAESWIKDQEDAGYKWSQHDNKWV